jgi:hypothetical protein
MEHKMYLKVTCQDCKRSMLIMADLLDIEKLSTVNNEAIWKTKIHIEECFNRRWKHKYTIQVAGYIWSDC